MKLRTLVNEAIAEYRLRGVGTGLLAGEVRVSVEITDTKRGFVVVSVLANAAKRELVSAVLDSAAIQTLVSEAVQAATAQKEGK